MRGEEVTNGFGGASPEQASGSGSDSEGSEGAGAEAEVLVEDAELPARALAALNALRKSRQHYDVLLVAGGEETPAHRAVLAAASPYLLQALGDAPALRVAAVDAASLRALVEWAYTGRLVARGSAAARRLYLAAWRLRAEAARRALAERLVRRAAPTDALPLRALPDLPPHLRHHLDTLIAAHFDEICASGALATLPSLTAELLRESSAEDGAEAPRAVADACLTWLRARSDDDEDLEQLCARTHLLYVDAGGELKDCGELPAARSDAPELQEYRREAASRRRREPVAAAPAPRPLAGEELGARERAKGAGGDCAVLAARALGPRCTQALLAVRGALVAARLAWRPAGGPVAKGGKLGHTQDAAPEPDGERRAELAGGRCAHGAAALASKLIVCGGYDRARVLRGCEAYCARRNVWCARADMRGARARFPAAALAGKLYVLGGSDGHSELDTVDSFEEGGENGLGVWRSCGKLPGARSHAAAAADEQRGALYVVGGWAGGRSLKAVHRYEPASGSWRELAPLRTGRSQCAAVVWGGALWALGGCDAWRCLASTELLQLDSGDGDADWTPGPLLPTARRSMGGCSWRGRLVLAGGSDGAASLRRVDWLLPTDNLSHENGGGWVSGPPLRRARAGLGLCELEGALYAAGGFSGREFLACIECLPDPDAEWTTLADPPRVPAPLGTSPDPGAPALTGKEDTRSGDWSSAPAAAGDARAEATPKVTGKEAEKDSQEDQRLHETAVQDDHGHDLEDYVPAEHEQAGRGRPQQKNPHAPKRPLSAFFWFTNDERSKAEAENPGRPTGDVARELARRWTAADTETKAKYEAIAEQDKARYDREMAAYEKGPLASDQPPQRQEAEEVRHSQADEEYN